MQFPGKVPIGHRNYFCFDRLLVVSKNHILTQKGKAVAINSQKPDVGTIRFKGYRVLVGAMW